MAQNVAGAPGSAPGEVDAGGLGAITAQLVRAAEVQQSLRGDSAAVVRLWQSFVQNPNPGWPAPQARPGAATSVLCAERLRLRSDGNVNAMLADGGMRLCVMVGTNRAIEVSGEAVPFVQRILAEREFVASDCLSWNHDGTSFEWSDVELTLAQLKAQGLIEDAEAAG